MVDKQVRGKYTLEYKLEAVRQVKAGQSGAVVAKVLGIPRLRRCDGWMWYSPPRPSEAAKVFGTSGGLSTSPPERTTASGPATRKPPLNRWVRIGNGARPTPTVSDVGLRVIRPFAGCAKPS
jgi:hypothetical protein